jgi:hypothetical protein
MRWLRRDINIAKDRFDKKVLLDSELSVRIANAENTIYI